jgi:hypothetical protein
MFENCCCSLEDGQVVAQFIPSSVFHKGIWVGTIIKFKSVKEWPFIKF